MQGRLALFANTDWYLYNFRLALAEAAREAGWEVLLLSPGGDYAQKLQKRGFHWRRIGLERRSLGPLAQLTAIREVRSALLEHRIDILHNFTLKCAILGSLAARTTRCTGTVNAITGLGYLFSNPTRKARIIRTLATTAMRSALPRKRTWTVFQNSDDQELFHQKRLCAPETTCVIPGSGVDCDRFIPPKRERNDGRVRILFVARLLRDKGIYELIDAARTIRTQAPQVEFWIAGSPDPGNPASVTAAELAAWKTERIANFLGHVDDMPRLYAGSDIVALPSYREGLPRSLIEAAACARAIVTTNAPGCRDVVKHGESGLIVTRRDSEGLARALLEAASCSHTRNNLGQAARSRAIEMYADANINQKTIALYTRLLPIVR